MKNFKFLIVTHSDGIPPKAVMIFPPEAPACPACLPVGRDQPWAEKFEF